jgi:hypothetical protein
MEWASEQMLLVSRVKEWRLIRAVRDVVGRTTWRRDSRKDLTDCDDVRLEYVGDGSASSGEDGWVGLIVKIFLSYAALCISERTESLGPETEMDWTRGVPRFHQIEE